MKKICKIITALFFLAANVFAQVPQKMSYQAVIRDGSNALITAAPVGMKISILQGSTSGTAVYIETQTPTTNANGLVSLEIGNGTVVFGVFSNIDWSNAPYFIKTETDPTGGTTYSISGTSEFLSVPYALYSEPRTYTIGLWPELGGYVFWISPDGKHGLVAETQDQSNNSTCYDAQNKISNPANHSVIGSKFRDWRMPTKFELDEMYLQKVAIGGFILNYYWCSTEYNFDSAWCRSFNSGIEFALDKVTAGYCVRSVRAF